jgi:glucokinase
MERDHEQASALPEGSGKLARNAKRDRDGQATAGAQRPGAAVSGSSRLRAGAMRRGNAVAIGVDLGGTKIQTVAVRAGSAEVLAQVRQATPASGGPASVVAAIAGAVAEVASRAGAAPAAIAGIGVGVPGQVDRKRGIVKGGANVSGFGAPLELAALLERAISETLGTAPALQIENDVRAAVLGELRLGAARPFANLVAIWLGTGVGGAVICEGAVHIGAGAAGEIGHLIVKPSGRRCSCGRRGCLEAYLGRACMEAAAAKRVANGQATELFALMAERGRERLTAGIWRRAYKDHDELARKLLRKGAWALGVAMASAQNLLDSEAILIGGGLGEKLPGGLLDRAQREMGKRLLERERPPELLRTALGDLGGAIGAAQVALGVSAS